MADPSNLPRPSELWKQLSSERKLEAADAFWRDENASTEQSEAVVLIAQRIKFRPKSVIALPVEKKAKYLISLPPVSEIVAARLLVAYHLATQRPMMAAFLDALGLKHEEGLIADEEVEAPPAETLKAAVAALRQRFAGEDVALYLSTLMWQDPDTWGGLAEVTEDAAKA